MFLSSEEGPSFHGLTCWYLGPLQFSVFLTVFIIPSSGGRAVVLGTRTRQRHFPRIPTNFCFPRTPCPKIVLWFRGCTDSDPWLIAGRQLRSFTTHGRPTFLLGDFYFFFFFSFLGCENKSTIFYNQEFRHPDTPSSLSLVCFCNHHGRTLGVWQLNHLLPLPGISCEVPCLIWLEIGYFCFHPHQAEAMCHTLKWGTPLPKLFQLLVLVGLFDFCSGKWLPGTWVNPLLQGLEKGGGVSTMSLSVTLWERRDLQGISVHFRDEKTSLERFKDLPLSTAGQWPS